MGVLAYIEDVEMVRRLLVAHHGSLIHVILCECYNAIVSKAESHISVGGAVAKETFQNCFAVDRDVQDATEGDVIFARSLIFLLQVCTDKVTVTLEFQAVYFRETLPQAVNEAVIFLFCTWCANDPYAAGVLNVLNPKASAATQSRCVDLRHMWISALCTLLCIGMVLWLPSVIGTERVRVVRVTLPFTVGAYIFSLPGCSCRRAARGDVRWAFRFYCLRKVERQRQRSFLLLRGRHRCRWRVPFGGIGGAKLIAVFLLSL